MMKTIKSIKNYWVKLTCLVLLIVLSDQLFPQCSKGTMAYQSGESLQYLAYYNWGIIWVNAGWVEFNVKDTIFNRQPVYHIDAYGQSHKSYDWFYKVRDRYQSFLDKESLLPLGFKRNNYEGGYEVDNKYVFDHKNNLSYTFTQNTNKPYLEDTIYIPDCTHDLISMVYHARNLDFTGLNIGDSIPINTIIDNEIFNLYIRYLGKEIIKTREGEKYKCIKFSALLVEGTMFKGGEDLFVWITDDKNRVPILVEAKILIGSAKAFFVKAKGLRYPMSSKIEK